MNLGLAGLISRSLTFWTIYRCLVRITNMNRIPVVLTIDEIEYLLDQLPPPDKDEEAKVTKLRQTLKLALEQVRKNAE